MTKKGVAAFFEEFLLNESLFRNRRVLQSSYFPETVLHREKEINLIASVLAPSLKEERPSNLFIYGNTGTGKTLSVRHIANNMEALASEKEIPLKIIYTNCKLKKISDTEYRLVSHLASFFGKSLPSTGLPTDEVYRIFYESVEQQTGVVLLILDEIDQIIKKAGDNVLYNITRINEDLRNAQISLIGISNSAAFMESLDPRVKSSLSEEDVFFSPYNAIQIQGILRGRIEKALIHNAVGPGVIEKTAAYAAREHGDARKAIELLKVAAELADRAREKQISLHHVDEAEDKLEREKIFDIVKNQPRQFQAALLSILSIKTSNPGGYTGEIYRYYRNLCFRIGLRPLTQRRISDIIRELELMGVVNTKTISKGRYGRTKDISLSVPSSAIPLTKKILEEELIS